MGIGQRSLLGIRQHTANRHHRQCQCVDLIIDYGIVGNCDLHRFPFYQTREIKIHRVHTRGKVFEQRLTLTVGAYCELTVSITGQFQVHIGYRRLLTAVNQCESYTAVPGLCHLYRLDVQVSLQSGLGHGADAYMYVAIYG